MNRKQRRAEEKTGKAAARPSGLLEETLFRQAMAHHQAGRLRDAEANYRDVLAANPRHTGALSYLGLLAHQAGHSDAAIDLLRKAIASDKRNPEPHYNLARILSDCGRDDDAIMHNRKALEIDPDFPGAHNNLGALLLLHGRPAEAFAAAIAGLRTDDAAGLKSTFVMALRSLDPAAIKLDPNVIQLLVRALREPWCRPRDLAAAAGTILLRTPAMARCVERASQAGRVPLNEMFSPADLAALGSDGLLEALLSASPVTTVAVERALTAVRRAALNDIATGALESDEAWLPLVAALGQQGFINEYVVDVTEDETAQLGRLRDDVAEAIARNEPVAPIKVAILASYLPLHSLAGADKLAAQSWPGAMAALVAQQIVDHRQELAIRPAIERLTAIEDDVSEKVRAQYEENPYPRWSRVFAETQALPIDAYIGMRFPGAPYKPLGDRAPDVLVAGCGTGQHAIQRAQQLKSAKVLAIDLSLSSLSYAIRKTKELGLTNLHYAQADILALDGDKTFDVIDSSGVLHHLKEPLTGWRRLAGLLRPGGLMHIGLYSSTARRDINTARAYLAQQGRGFSVPEVRRLRAEFAARAPGDELHNITQFSDFFSMSECRDLLFHVQEHQFSIPQIADFLGESGFTFLGFEAPARTGYLRRFPGDRTATNLANWAAFEAENPSTFAQMYQFWIQKN
ncbi:2-polyprenyl-3-methyl-5-hydroxy-6-metoxy-1,4-benzoquinol methylase [Afipia massiliensis]|uniref:2-polyprenyl-3-methyl-5-hydroxy-6-metoxy-1, 4-benzoquinol methylase n=1 Tax=Afipia massiliensis TaxID=211460 RepID=A0A840N2D2_9BRAD|nr:2-polyprenyl-3-methyl-5-hydroxy-6-metoxy-1,4-benzoquinol methylase [Afipia massiliensis]